MKQLVLMSLLIATAVNLLVGQEKKQKDEMVFSKTVNGQTMHDYGSIVFGADGSVDFVFTNEGKNPLVITNVASTCGCTVPTWPKEPVEPGEKDTITVVYNTNLAGPFNKTIVVYSNANNSPVRISIMGKVNAKASDINAGKKDTGIKTAEQERQEELDAINAASPQLIQGGTQAEGLPADKQRKKQAFQEQFEKSATRAGTKNNPKAIKSGTTGKAVISSGKK